MTPVQYTAANKAIVEAFDRRPPDQKSAAYWSHDEVLPVKNQIKTYYITEQDHRCCYCATRIPTNHQGVWDAEHVISRNTAPKYLFEPRNLAVACKDCNIAKSDEEVRVNALRVTFPTKSANYKIVHPHFDNYRDHIRWFGSVCSPLTHKGISTVAMCNLMRFSLAKLGNKAPSRHPHFDHLIGDLMAAGDDVEVAAALNGLQTFVRSIPQPTAAPADLVAVGPNPVATPDSEGSAAERAVRENNDG